MKVWAGHYVPMLCPTCGYNMGKGEPGELAVQCSDCAITNPQRGDTVEHLMEMLKGGGISPEQFTGTILAMAKGGGEQAASAARVGANPHALDAVAAADGGFKGADGISYDVPVLKATLGPDSPVPTAQVEPQQKKLIDPLQAIGGPYKKGQN